MRLILVLVVLILAALGAYAGYWFYAAGQIRAQVAAWEEAREAEGWLIGHEQLAVAGFPGAHRIVMEGVDLAAPPARGAWRVRTATLQAEAGGPFNFSDWTLRPASEALITLAGGEEAVLGAESSRLEMQAEGGQIGHFYGEAQALSISAPTASIEGAESLFIQGDRLDGAWRVQFETRGARIADGGFGDARAAFGGTVQVLALDVQAQQEGLAALAAGLAGLQDAGELTVNAAHLEWGAAVLSGQGALGVDAMGRLRGDFDVAVADVAQFLGALAGAGLLEARQANIAVAASAFFPRDDQDRIVLPFSFEGGDTRLGPAPIGPAPQVYNPAAAAP